MQIITLTLDMIRKNWHEFESLEKNSGLFPVWSMDNFQLSLPCKWDLSKALIENHIMCGYAIFSEKSSDCAHLHRIVIDQRYQCKGLGSDLINKSITDLLHKYKFLTLKVGKENTKAFYEKQGFSTLFSSSEYTYMIFSRQYD